MAEHRRSITLRAGFDRVFEYLADVRNLPRYFDRMTSAEPTGAEEVHATAEYDGHKVEGDAWFRVDRTANRIQWGSEGETDYHGTMQVTAVQDRTTIDITLHTDHDVDAGEIDQSLDTTLQRISELLEQPVKS